MKSTFRHMLAVLAVAFVVLSACGGSGDKLIPRGKMSRIYAEMLLTDQWINESVDIKRMADTTLIYEPILEKYGYDKMDYIHSVDVYLDDPERFAKIWEHTSEILDERLKKLNARKKEIEEERERNKIVTDFAAEAYFPYMHDEPYIHYYDSLSVELDTLLNAYRFTNIERSDTTFDGLLMNVRIDTLSVADTVAESDSVAVRDSVAKQDIVLVLKEISTEVVPEQIQPSKELKKIKDMPRRAPMQVKDLAN